MFLPNWWFFNLLRVSYWSRCVIVPLLIILQNQLSELMIKNIFELFIEDPLKLEKLDFFKNETDHPKNGFILLDRFLKSTSVLFLISYRNRALKKAESWLRDHSKGVG